MSLNSSETNNFSLSRCICCDWRWRNVTSFDASYSVKECFPSIFCIHFWTNILRTDLREFLFHSNSSQTYLIHEKFWPNSDLNSMFTVQTTGCNFHLVLRVCFHDNENSFPWPFFSFVFHCILTAFEVWYSHWIVHTICPWSVRATSGNWALTTLCAVPGETVKAIADRPVTIIFLGFGDNCFFKIAQRSAGPRDDGSRRKVGFVNVNLSLSHYFLRHSGRV